MSMMIMFGDETFDGFSVREQHIVAQKKIRVAVDIALLCFKSCEHRLRGSGLFAFVRVFGAALAHTQLSNCFEVFA